MEVFIALLGGISAKLYDDIVDSDITVNDTVKESLKGIQWTTLTALSLHDFNFTFLMYFLNFVNHLVNPEAFKLPYEYSLLLVYPFLMFLNYDTVQYLNPINLVMLVPCMLSVCLEPYLFTEDVSYNKFISRTCISIILIIFILFNNYLNISPSILKISIYALGYLITSSCFQLYLLYNKNQKDNSNKPDTPESDERST